MRYSDFNVFLRNFKEILKIKIKIILNKDLI